MARSLKPWALQRDRKTLSPWFFLVALRRPGLPPRMVPSACLPMVNLPRFLAGRRHLLSRLSRMIRGGG